LVVILVVRKESSGKGSRGSIFILDLIKYKCHDLTLPIRCVWARDVTDALSTILRLLREELKEAS
jgi:hypothetical protein